MWWANVELGLGWWPKLYGGRPKTCDETGGTDPDCVRARVTTDRLAVIYH